MKSLLIIDTPRNCQECLCSDVHQDFDGLRHMCRFTCLELTGENMVHTRPNWCPLKPMPCKSVWNNDYSDGYNACIDEILGETE